jgi:predicted acetyltransferase
VHQVEVAGRTLPELADLFVLPRYRRQGIAAQVVAALVRPDTGQWLLAPFGKDLDAYAFWRRNLPRMRLSVELLVDADDTEFRQLLISVKTGSVE